MVTLTEGETGIVPAIAPRATPVHEFSLRFISAVLQILATIAVVRVLPPDATGVYFKGFVIAHGLAALLCGKYDLFIAHYFIGTPQVDYGIPARCVLSALGRRVLIRSAIAGACLLVITADLDIVEPHLQPYVETYLPFVLAIPFAAFALLMAGALRVVNRTLGSMLVSTYCMNIAILLAASAAPPQAALLILSWAFFAGSVLNALMGLIIVRRVFGVTAAFSKVRVKSAAWREIQASVAGNGVTALAAAGLRWGPLCVLALLGPAVRMAEFAVAARTAQIVDFMIPAIIFLPQSIHLQPRLTRALRSLRGKLTTDLAVSLASGSAFVVAVAIMAPWLADLYGPPYAGLVSLFAILLAMQWVTAAGRPALRFVATEWPVALIRRTLVVSATSAIALSLAGIRDYGTLAIAAGMLVGTLLLNGQAIWSAYSLAGSRPVSFPRS
jgi:hypothetical protein